MSDVLYVLLTLALFVLLSLLVGVLDRRAGASDPATPATTATPATPATTEVAVGRVAG